MTSNTKILFYLTILLTAVILYSCGNNDGKDKGKAVKDSTKLTGRIETKKEPDAKTQRPPIINIVDTLAPKRIVIYCSDSAATFERISLKLAKIYGAKLPEYLKKNKLKSTGAHMAWYRKQKVPYFFEAGIPVNKKGTRTVAGVKLREMPAGKVLIAHFYGPFELLPQGYDVIKEWMKDNKKIAAGTPYEIYITDPIDKNGKPVDPYKIQTDIVFPIK
jgi:effector-binding domain-containing protein